MKFHWSDDLNRDGGHWSFTPNNQRHMFYAEDCATLPNDVQIVTVSKSTSNLERLSHLEKLEELTLHESNQSQIDFLAQIPQIKRLRITHARPNSISSLSQLPNVRELILEYVSGFEDISPLTKMPSLRAVHLENLRRVRDFSPLGDAKDLQYLAIVGTCDWQQPITGINFAGRLRALDYLSLNSCRIEDQETAKALMQIGDRCQFHFAPNLLSLEMFAYLEAHCPMAKFEPVIYWYVTHPLPLSKDDVRAEMSDSEIRADHPEIIICKDGLRIVQTPSEYDVYRVLGRGARNISVKTKAAPEKAAAYAKKYDGMVEQFRAIAAG